MRKAKQRPSYFFCTDLPTFFVQIKLSVFLCMLIFIFLLLYHLYL